MEEDLTTLAFTCTGRVQGVSFRAWVQAQARELDVAGWVRNERDGSVTGLLHGAETAVRTLVDRLGEGPAQARVASVTTQPMDDVAPEGFVILQ